MSSTTILVTREPKILSSALNAGLAKTTSRPNATHIADRNFIQTLQNDLFNCAQRLRADCSVGRDHSLVAARDRSFQSAPCFCQFIRMWRLVVLFLPSATAWLSATQWNLTIAAVSTRSEER